MIYKPFQLYILLIVYLIFYIASWFLEPHITHFYLSCLLPQ